MTNPFNPQTKMKYFIIILSTGIGIGYSPFAPGTLGSLLAIPVCLFFRFKTQFLYLPFLIIFIFFSIWISDHAQKYFAKVDDQRIVIDEVSGLLCTFLFLEKSFFSILTGFILFRIFDILKPFPIRRLEKRLKGGYGIVFDDVVAGLYANIIIRIIFYLFIK